MDATVDLNGGMNTVALTERALWSDAVFTETTVEVNSYRTDATPQGGLPMELLPEDTHGNFFNRQMRTTTSYQFVETLSGSARRANMLHLFKAGIDVLHSRFDGSSSSAAVLVKRSDGTLVRRLDYSAPTIQDQNSTDVALFAQDRVQPTNRWYVEFGARLDRDGVIDRVNLTPRLGSALLFNNAGTSVLRGGVGLFYERTPSAAGSFTQYERAIDTRYLPGGAVAQAFPHTMSDDLRTSRSLTWDLAYDHRFNANWALHFGTVDRHGDNELLVVPVVKPGGAELRLVSDGHSRYSEAEVGVHYTLGTRVDLNVCTCGRGRGPIPMRSPTTSTRSSGQSLARTPTLRRARTCLTGCCCAAVCCRRRRGCWWR